MRATGDPRSQTDARRPAVWKGDGQTGKAVEITVWCCAVACTGQAQGVSGISKAFSAASAIRPAILHRRFDPLMFPACWLMTFGC